MLIKGQQFSKSQFIKSHFVVFFTPTKKFLGGSPSDDN